MRCLAMLIAVMIVQTMPAVAQDLYKCKMPDGRTIISNIPCAGGNTESVAPETVPHHSTPSAPLAPPRSGAPPSSPSALPPLETVPPPFSHQASDETCATLGKGAEGIAIL